MYVNEYYVFLCMILNFNVKWQKRQMSNEQMNATKKVRMKRRIKL